MSAGPCENPQPGDCVHGNRFHCRDCGGLPIPAPPVVGAAVVTPVCEDCKEPITGRAVCRSCHDDDVTEACAETRLEAEAEQDWPADVIREYASSKRSLGQITPELARALEDCADDLEQAI